jgi:hypothetical protein
VNFQLEPGIVADDDDLAEVVGRDPESEVRRLEILGVKEQLRALVDEGSWQKYVTLGELRDARHADLIVNVTRWAFEEGRKYPHRCTPIARAHRPKTFGNQFQFAAPPTTPPLSSK